MEKFLKNTIRILRPIYWPFIKVYFLYLSPETRGVRVILTYKGAVLFIKNSYGLKYNFPGGNLRKSEDPKQGARREVKEEVGVEVRELKLIGTIIPPIEFEYRKNTIYIFSGELSNKDTFLNNLEVSEAKWLSISNPPPMGHAATLIFEYYKESLKK